MSGDAKHTPVPGFPLYAVDRSGRVWSIGHNWRGYGVREIVPTLNSDGYRQVRLSIEGRRLCRTVHGLVALTFHGPRPSPRHQVCHANGNRTDNRAENLRWGTGAENAADRTAHGRAYKPDWSDPERRARWVTAMRNGKPRGRNAWVSR